VNKAGLFESDLKSTVINLIPERQRNYVLAIERHFDITIFKLIPEIETREGVDLQSNVYLNSVVSIEQ
jgi:hypothetical protein